MDTPGADDKIQAVVRLVLQAVDQRLETLREQLVQVTHTVAANHAELGRRIDECHQVIAAVQAGAASNLGSSVGARTAPNVGAVDALTAQVSALQARLDEMTTARAADLAAAIAAASPPRVEEPAVAASAPPSVGLPTAAKTTPAWLSNPTPAPTPKSAPTSAPKSAPTAPTLASTPVLTPAPAPAPAAVPTPAPRSAPVLAPPAAAAAPPAEAPAAAESAPTPAPRQLSRVVAASPRVKSSSPRAASATDAPPAPSVPARTNPTPAELPVDLASLNEQISARLAAAVDRALGELGTADLPSKSA